MTKFSVTMDKDHLTIIPVGRRYYELAQDTVLTLDTDKGSFEFKFQKGFVTNFRSGGPLVDGFIDQIGTEKTAQIYLLHDAAYTPCDNYGGKYPFPREDADIMLRDGLGWANMSKFKRNMAYRSVRLFGQKAYDDDDNYTNTNRTLFTFKEIKKEDKTE